MLEVTLFNVETKEKGTVVCEEINEYGGKLMCCYATTVRGTIDPIGYMKADYETHITVPTNHLSHVISI